MSITVCDRDCREVQPIKGLRSIIDSAIEEASRKQENACFQPHTLDVTTGQRDILMRELKAFDDRLAVMLQKLREDNSGRITEKFIDQNIQLRKTMFTYTRVLAGVKLKDEELLELKSSGILASDGTVAIEREQLKEKTNKMRNVMLAVLIKALREE